MISSPRVADTALTVSATSFLGAHWFLATQTILHMGAEIVSIASGVGAFLFYLPTLTQRARTLWNKLTVDV